MILLVVVFVSMPFLSRVTMVTRDKGLQGGKGLKFGNHHAVFRLGGNSFEHRITDYKTKYTWIM